MSDSYTFTDISDAKPRKQEFWPTLIVPRASIDAEIERLASIARPDSGRRASAISHPSNTGPVRSGSSQGVRMRLLTTPSDS